MNEEEAIAIFRFSEYQWVEQFISKGKLSFSCVDNYIRLAKCSNDKIQGDEKEAVFARFRKDDERILKYKIDLGNDLEVIEDGDFVLLRRRSARFKPVFCFYRFLLKDLRDGDFKLINNSLAEVKMRIDRRIFEGFSGGGYRINGIREGKQPTSVVIRVEPFIGHIWDCIVHEKHKFMMKSIDYDLMKEETFEIIPTNNYQELFYKSPEYAYQREGRIIIKDVNLCSGLDRMDIVTNPYNENDYKYAQEPFDFTFVIRGEKHIK